MTAPTTPPDVAALIERLADAAMDFGTSSYDRNPAREPKKFAHYLVAREALASALAALQAEVERLRADLAKVTDPAYLASAIERVGMVDAEWQARATAAEAEIARLRTRLEADGTNLGTGERVSVEPYDGIAVRDERVAALEAEVAARDETIRGLRSSLRVIAEGNLGPERWQADYTRIQAWARAAIGEDE